MVASPQNGVTRSNAWSFNFVSRMIGFVVRIHIIFFCLLLLLLNMVWWAAVLILGWPILLVLDLIQNLNKKSLDKPLDSQELSNWEKDQEVQKVFVRAELSESEIKLFWHVLNSYVTSMSISRLSSLSKVPLAGLVSLISDPKLREREMGRSLPWSLLEEVAVWHWQIYQEKLSERAFWSGSIGQQIRPIGADWGYGYTPNLDRFSRNLNHDAERSAVSLNARPQLLRKLADTFTRSTNAGILLVGQPGIGKLSLCVSLAKHIAQKNTFPALVDHRVMLLDLNQILGITTDPATQALVLNKIFAEASSAGNIIIVIDNLHQYVSPTGLADFSHVFAKVNRSYKLKLVALSTYDNFRQHITANPTVMTRFEVVHMNPTNNQETLDILQEIVTGIEGDATQITLPAIKELIKKSALFLEHVPNPEKSINLLETCLADTGSLPVTKRAVGEILTKKTGIPLGEMNDEEKTKLLDLRRLLSLRVVGQSDALDALTAAVKRANLRLETREKTKGAFLFLGPTGVGKTETVKALAEIYFGSPEKMIRVDMGEYGNADSLSNLIGSPQSSGSHAAGGLLTEAVRQQPYTTVLLDELEKAHPQILNALLTVLDEGYLKDARDQRISFRHSFVIATSNAGSQLFYSSSGDNQTSEISMQTMIDHLVSEKIFTPEFLNRFDGIVLFSPLTPAEITEIVQRKLKKIEEQIFVEHKLRLKISPNLMEKIVQSAYNPQFGARHLERVLTKEVVDRIAEKLLNDEARSGTTLKLDL